MDAARSPTSAMASSALVFFSCNGIDMVNHEGRPRSEAKVRRLL